MKLLIFTLAFTSILSAQSGPADPLATANAAIATAQGSAKAIADNLTTAAAALSGVQVVSAQDAALLAWIKSAGNAQLLAFARAQIAAGTPVTSSYSFGIGSTLACSSSAPITVVAPAVSTAVKQ